MDAIDILGELLGHKTSKKGKGGDILKDIFRRGSSKPAARQPATRAPSNPNDIHREARELEDLLNVANHRNSQSRSTTSTTPTQKNTPRHDSSQRRSEIQPNTHRQKNPDNSSVTNMENQRAMALVHAMLNAAKSDGKIDRQEKQNILNRLGRQPPEVIDYLEKQMDQPLDLEGFVRSIPLGMEQQIYRISLIAIDLNTRGEANYLLDLAQGLRLKPDLCASIHQELGAVNIFNS